MPAPSPDANGLIEFFYYAGLAAAAVVAGFIGYRGRAAPTTTATVAGALVDNSVVKPLQASIERLCFLMEEDITLRKREMEHEKQEEQAAAIARKAFEHLKDEMLRLQKGGS